MPGYAKTVSFILRGNAIILVFNLVAKSRGESKMAQIADHSVGQYISGILLLC